MLLDKTNVENIHNDEDLDYYWRTGLDYILANDWELAQTVFLMTFLGCESEQHEQAVYDGLMEFLCESMVPCLSNSSTKDADKILNFTKAVFQKDLSNSLVKSFTEPIRLHIGGQEAHPDWKIFDALPRKEVDFIGNAKDLNMFANNSIAAIYTSHVLEHFYYLLNNELILTLKEWYRVLQPGGELMVSVPNLQVICSLYADPKTPPNARHHLMRMIFGGQIDQYDVHKVGFDQDTLGMYLQEAGFYDLQVVSEFRLFNDCSSLLFAGVPISLNMIAKK
jgi:predicted SAM-dependent methyltransferase